jgi:hypothetical protein
VVEGPEGRHVNDEVPVDKGRSELLWKCCGEGFLTASNLLRRWYARADSNGPTFCWQMRTTILKANPVSLRSSVLLAVHATCRLISKGD